MAMVDRDNATGEEEQRRRKEGGSWGQALWSLLRSLVAAALLLALAGGTSYAVVTWRLGTEGDQLKAEWEGKWAEFQAAHATSPEALTAEVADLKKALQDYRAAAETRLAALENAAQTAGEGRDQAVRVGRDLNIRAALLKAESELTAARLELGTQNRGRAAAELELADQTLTALVAGSGTPGAPGFAPVAETLKKQLDDLLAVIRAARLDLAAGLPTAADRISLAGHSVGVILAAFQGQGR